MYLLLDSAGVPSQIYYVLDLADRIDPAALRRALTGLLDDVPQLRSRVVRHWFAFRRILMPLAEVDLDSVLTVTSDDEAADAFFQHRPDLARRLPIQLLLHQSRTHDQLVVAIHHSLADGQALLFLLSRLGDRYAAAITREPLSSLEADPGGEARYRRLLWSLSWPERWRVFQQSFRYLWDGARLPGSSTLPAMATFTDVPLPAEGRLRYVRIGVSFQQIAALMRWAAKRHGSPTDVLLTASLRAAITIWPRQAATAIGVSLPVSVRSSAAFDVTNRVVVMDFLVRAGDFEAMFAQVSTATAQARTRHPAVLNMFKFAVPSYLPPPLFRHLAKRYLNRAANVRESLTFTALGVFDGGPQRFGPATVTDSVLLGSVIAPPAIKVHVSPHGGRLNLCVAYLDPVIAPASIASFADAVRMELAMLTSVDPTG